MSDFSKRSVLQTQVLGHLLNTSVPSVTALAEAIGSPRPSVSRSVHILADQGLVEQHGRSWMLTDSGKGVAEQAVTQFTETAEEMIELAGHRFKAVARLGYGDTLSSVAKKAFDVSSLDIAGTAASAVVGSLGEQLVGQSIPSSVSKGVSQNLDGFLGLKAMASSLGLAAMDKPLPGSQLVAASQPRIAAMVQDVGLGAVASNIGLATMGSSLPNVAAMMAASINAISATSQLISAQTDYSAFLSMIPTSEHIIGYTTIAEQTHLLSGALDDALHLDASATMIGVLDLAENNLIRMPASLVAVTGSLAEVFHDTVRQLEGDASHARIADAADWMLLSTRPVTDFADAARLFIENDVKNEHPIPFPERRVYAAQEYDNTRLDTLLDQLNPRFPEKRRGSWMALESDNPERFSHAAGSQRNLLTQVVRHIMPEFEVPENDQPGSVMKARIRQVFGVSKSDAEHVKALANAVYTGYSQFCKYDHTNPRQEGALRGTMRAAEGLMEIILVHVLAPSSSDDMRSA